MNGKINYRIIQRGISMDIQDKEYIEKSFMSYCCTVLKNEANNIKRNIKRRKVSIIPFSSFDNEELLSLKNLMVSDKYSTDKQSIKINNTTVNFPYSKITNIVLQLPQKERDVILLFYFKGYSDKQISSIKKVSRQYITALRKKGLTSLRKVMSKGDVSL